MLGVDIRNSPDFKMVALLRSVCQSVGIVYKEEWSTIPTFKYVLVLVLLLLLVLLLALC